MCEQSNWGPTVVRVLGEFLNPAARPETEAELAERLGYTERHLRRMFLAETAEPLGQFMHRLPVEYAAGLLVTTDSPIKEVAHRAGYSSSQSLCKLFRRQFDESPSGFRSLNSGELHAPQGYFAFIGRPHIGMAI